MKIVSLVFLLIGAAQCRADLLTPVWVELSDNGPALARVIVSDSESCPSITIDGSTRRMQLRTPVPAGFRPLCESTLAVATREAFVGEQRLMLPKSTLSKVLVLGDTGCRIRGARVQDCNDPEVWPFQKVSAQAAAEHPDLVIHVGDYLYREDMCPATAQSKCAGTPNGDNWETWNADFFDPAARLLAAAVWAPVRGNHEDCKRAWRGWFYYLDPRPWKGESCEEMTPPYVAGSVKPSIVMFDSSSVSEDERDATLEQSFARQFASIQQANSWLVAHHPVWGVRPGKNGNPVPVSPGFGDSWLKGTPQGVDLIVSGHTHLFELLTFGELPIQLVAGIGGTQLSAPLTGAFEGLHVGSATIMSGQSRVEFGYTLLTRNPNGWDLVLKNHAGRELVACVLEGKSATCRNRQANEPSR